MPDDMRIAFGLNDLCLTGCNIDMEDLDNIIRACPNLEAYAHQEKLINSAPSNYDHIAEIKALAETVGNKLKVLMLQVIDDGYWQQQNDSEGVWVTWRIHFTGRISKVQVNSYNRFTVLQHLHIPKFYRINWVITPGVISAIILRFSRGTWRYSRGWCYK